MSWRIVWTRRAEADFAALETKLRKRVAVSLERLANTGQGDVKKLKGKTTCGCGSVPTA